MIGKIWQNILLVLKIFVDNSLEIVEYKFMIKNDEVNTMKKSPFIITNGYNSRIFAFKNYDECDVEFKFFEWENDPFNFVDQGEIEIINVNPENFERIFSEDDFVGTDSPSEELENLGVMIYSDFLVKGKIHFLEIEFDLIDDYFILLWDNQYVFRAGHYKGFFKDFVDNP